MAGNVAKNLSKWEQERIERLKKIDLINLRNADMYRFKVSDGISTDVVLEGEVEAPNGTQAKDWVKFEYQEELAQIGDYDIYIYQWIPETVDYDGSWELVDSWSDKEGLLDLEKLEGKTIESVDMMFQGGKSFLRFRFTDHTHFDVEDVRYKDWYVSPF